jgi:hypothetical protein
MRASLGLMLAAALLSTPAYALDFEFSLGEDVAEVLFMGDSGSIGGWGGTQIYGGLLFNDDSDYIGEVGAMARRPPSPDFPLTAGVGLRGYLGNLDDPDATVGAVAIGGELGWTIPSKMPMAVLGQLHWAPAITSFGDTDGVLDWMIRYQIEVMPQTLFFVSWRNLNIDWDTGGGNSGDTDVVDNLMLGVRFSF